MADPVPFAFVEKENLTGFGHRLVAAKMPRENAPKWKHKLGAVGAFLGTMPAAAAAAADMPDRHARRLQQGLHSDFRRRFQVVPQRIVNLMQDGRAAASLYLQ